MKMQYSYSSLDVDVEFTEIEGFNVNPHDIVMKIAELARLVDVYDNGHIKITVTGGESNE
jgi:hypothetical protein